MSSFLDSIKSGAISEAQASIGGSTVNPQKELSSFGEKKSKYYKETRSEIEVKRYNINTGLRRYLAIWASVIVLMWLIFVFIILIYNNSCFKLSNSIIITLLTTTTVNVLGLVIIAMSDLFNGKSEHNGRS